MNPTAGKLLWRLQKYKSLIDGLILGRAPDFIVQRKPPRILDHIPVFTFHVAVPERFEAQCAHIAENDYHAVDGVELDQIMQGTVKPRPNSIAITFDDGLKQVWTVALPILRKYGLKAIVFLIPGCISEEPRAPRKTLEDVWRGEASEQEVLAIMPGETPLATWQEIREMHESGHVDFQSHSMWHSLVYRSDEVVDFGRPDYRKHYIGNIRVPLYQSNGVDRPDRELLLGMPIYSAAPRFQVTARFFDDEGLRESCVGFVDKNGGAAFFELDNWRDVLSQEVKRYKLTNQLTERMETPIERDTAVKAELRMAKEAIEQHLGGKVVEHFCFPWYKGATFAHHCAFETGHKLVYTDYERDFTKNVPGSKASAIARFDEVFLRRLPGNGRISKAGIVRELIGLRGLPKRMFPKHKGL